MMEKIIVMTASELEIMIEKVVRRVIVEKPVAPEMLGSFPMLLSLQDTAIFLDLAPQTIYGYTAKRMIPFIKKCKELYFNRSDLEEWLNEGKKKTLTEIERDIKNTGKY